MTIISPNTLKVGPGYFEDGQAAQSIAPSDVRTMVDSLVGLFSAAQTVSYTAVLTDAGTCVDMNSGSALNFTVPPNSSVAFDIGTIITICQLGAGQVTLVQGAGVTLSTPATLTTRQQFSTVAIRKQATNVWIVSGDLT